MKTIEWKNVDKSSWPRGPWDNEPDAMQFADEATGLPCLVKRNHFGAWCGYVGVAAGHPAFEQERDFDVHGSITFRSFCDGEPGTGICHLPDAGEPDRVWWFGFDCAHGWDFCPGMEARLRTFCRMHGESYKDLAYVKEECRKLAAQLA
jgi:hypothetical protein